MDAIRRPDDNELCGFVDRRGDGWHALTVFGGRLGVHATKPDAEAAVHNEGLSSLMERWILVDGEDTSEQVVCIQEANPHSVTLALDYYSMPGVPTMRIERAQLDAGRWTLTPNR